ncbi:molybdopterin-guanine dinucleotide biosynthesis protein B [uncultured Pseudodesulfovibrio sp.]|uniref:molybdopterin-guanine dinucleotide biosynthesis protein B n=1 Tax=uncultured Pseudodesulfovibrio sp. TaxID=2035858 RepID=UPI0029C7305C|nr:molybdopterin-guanine dinucleotide biosynthesis protein B [uncultured Pseudodesulfovibrio sp.]
MTPPVICIVGKKKSGKTTFIEKLIPELQALGLSVGTVKHDAHSFDMDHEGKDSWRHRHCGAETVVVSSPAQVAVIRSLEKEMLLSDLAETYFADRHLVVAEGYFRSDQPKIEIHRVEAHDEPLCSRANEEDKHLFAMVTDGNVDTGMPVFGLEDVREVAALVARRFKGWTRDRMWG